MSIYFAHLMPTYVNVLAIYAFGMMLVHNCGQTLVASAMGVLLEVKPNTMKRRLREVTYEKDAKSGAGRTEFDVTTCFVPLFKWILSYFDPDQRRIVLACDATNLRDRFVILSVSIVFNHCAIPVAWHIQAQTQKGEWNPIWQRLLRSLHEAVDPSWTVYVLTDGGLYARPLFRFIRDTLHWHPHMRLGGLHGKFLIAGGTWQPLTQLVSRGMSPAVYQLTCFKGKPIRCTLLVQWDADCDVPCLVVTDLAPEQACVKTYSLRYWIESGFKAFKRGHLHWEHTKMKDPKRAERLWLVMSIANFRLLCCGQSNVDLDELSFGLSALSTLTRGWLTFILSLILQRPMPTKQPFAYDLDFLPLLPG
jgi:hypothetical protein